MRQVLLVAALWVAAAGVAPAQDKPVDVNFGFGVAIPVTGLNDSFDTGWNGNAGVTFNVTPTFGVQAEYMYMRMDGPEKTISIVENPIAAIVTNGLLEANHQVHALTFNGVYKAKTDGVVGGYGLAGLGWYHRTVQVTSPSVGYTTYCDPYWYICYPVLVPVDTIIGDRSSNDFGINVGGGITFGRSAKFYIEARYHYVWGPTITRPAEPGREAEELSTNAGYFPITFGIRW